MIHFLSKEEASRVPEAAAVAGGDREAIQMTGTIGGISKTTGSSESAVVAVATADSTSASNSHSTTMMSHKSLNLKIIAAAEAA